MRIQHFLISEHGLKYTVLLNTVELTDHKMSLNQLFTILEELQTKYPTAIIQFFNSDYVLNEDHLYHAIYFVQKAFKYGQHISQKASIEFLLYLSTNRQIKKAIEAFGISASDLNEKLLDYCIVANGDEEVNKINTDLLTNFSCIEKQSPYIQESEEKYNRLLSYFGFSTNQIKTRLNSLEVKRFERIEVPLKDAIRLHALEDLIIEKMALLSLE
ncbi:MAG: putative Kinase binding protein [Promethearchaeota archaeon]|nr:MAG: putative Kinase binding protein [Candidatus Lokiarchaeota archaeon]